VSTNGQWQASIFIGRGKRKTIGLFDSEYEAAEAHNKAALEFCEKNCILNLLDEGDRPENLDFKRKFFQHKSGNKSIYFGVSKQSNSNKWIARINTKNGRELIGSFDTEWLAALAFNKRSMELFIDNSKLNKLSEVHERERETYVQKTKKPSSKFSGVT